MSDNKQVLKDTVGFWIATRLNGGSASMNDPMGPMDRDLLKVMDEKLYERVKIAARDPYADGMNRVATTPEPEGQKFPVGSRVKISSNLGSSMAHFSGAGEIATVEYTYAHAFGGDNVSSYSLNIDGRGSSAWYRESQLAAYKDKEPGHDR